MLPDKDPVNLRQIDELSESESFHSLNNSELSTKKSRFKIKVNSLALDNEKHLSHKLKERGKTYTKGNTCASQGCEAGALMLEIRKL